jgi:hypothetical protein
MTRFVQGTCKDGRAIGTDVLQFSIGHGKQTSRAGNPDSPAFVLAGSGNRSKGELRGVIKPNEMVAGLVAEAAVGAYPKRLVSVLVDAAHKSVG